MIISGLPEVWSYSLVLELPELLPDPITDFHGTSS